RIGLAVRRAQDLACTERRLKEAPKLSEAYGAGVLSYSKVRALLRVLPPDEADGWVERARCMSVRRLEEALRECKPDADHENPEDAAGTGRWIEVKLKAEELDTVETAFELA